MQTRTRGHPLAQSGLTGCSSGQHGISSVICIPGMALAMASIGALPEDAIALPATPMLIGPITTASMATSNKNRWTLPRKVIAQYWHDASAIESGVHGDVQVRRALRPLGRWMRMITIPNQSSIAKAYQEFDGAGRMKPSSYYDRVVDVCEELVKFTLLTRDASNSLVDRYSERKEEAESSKSGFSSNRSDPADARLERPEGMLLVAL